MTTTTELHALTEIEYRAWWLEQELADRGAVERAVLAEELAGIRAAVERERSLANALTARIELELGRARSCRRAPSRRRAAPAADRDRGRA